MIAEAIDNIRKELPQGVGLVAVSKFHTADAVKEAYLAGQRKFGESRVQELLEKIPLLPSDIEWHFIGHLQTNKVRQLVGKVLMIESIDSERLLDLIDKESARVGVVTNVLLQVHVAREETKFGFSPDELFEYADSERWKALDNVRIRGIMGMASNTDDEERVRADFKSLKHCFDSLRKGAFADKTDFDTLSMGMSGDWRLAVEEGSNLVRIGSAIFGQRDYSKGNHA